LAEKLEGMSILASESIKVVVLALVSGEVASSWGQGILQCGGVHDQFFDNGYWFMFVYVGDIA
jgi:hypothetical protein